MVLGNVRSSRAAAFISAGAIFAQTALSVPAPFWSSVAKNTMGSTLALPKPNKKGPATLLPKPAVLLLPFLSVSTAFALGGILNPPPLSPAPGPAYPWQPSFPVYSGSANIATGNLTLMHNICGWESVGPSTSFRLIFNSQSSDTGTLGSKWMHSYGWKVTAGNPAIVTYGDGRRVSFSLVGASYVPPSYIHETLTNHIGGGYDLTFKNGTVYVFNSAGKLTSITDLNGNTAALAYTSGNLTSVTDAVGRVLAIGYTSGKITSVTDAESRVWTLTYDASGRLEKVIMPLDGGNSYFTKFTYNTDNDVATITDRLNHTWTYDYSANDCFSTCTDPLSGIRGYVAVTPGMLDPNFTSAQPELTILPDQNNGTFSLDTDSTVYLQNEAGNAIQFGMDENGRMTAFRDSLGNQTNFTYDTSNNRTSIIEPGTQATQFTYDAKGNVLTVKDPLQHTTTYTYDSWSMLLTSKDALNHTTTNTYDTHENLETATDATSRTTTYGYYSNGLVHTVTDNGQHATAYEYDTYGNIKKIKDPLLHETTYVYNCCRPTSRTDARGRTTTYGYDDWGRRTSIDYPSSTDQSFTFDAEGRLLTASDGTGYRTYTYNALGNKTDQTDPRGNTHATYDAASRLLSQTDVTGRLIEYDYDANGRLELVSDPSSWASYTYDPRGRMTRETFSNGVYSQYGYDWASRLTSLNHKKSSDNSVILGYSATYDNANRLLTSTESPVAATTTYAYDDANRLTSEDRAGSNPYLSDYTYNADGLRATAFRSEDGVTSHDGTYTYDAASRLTSMVEDASGVPVAENYGWYDDNRLKTYPGPGYTRLLDYDEEGRLTSIKRDNGTTQTLAYEYAYGFDGGRRWRKDYDNNEWDWMPCGVACSAGELVVLQNSIGGSTWTSLFNLVPGRIWPFLPDVFVTVGPTDQPDRTFDPAGLPVLTMKFDSFGVDRLESQTGNAHPRDWFMRYLDWLDEFLKKFVRERNQPMMLDEWDPCQDGFYIEGRCRMAGCGNWPVDDLGSMISAAADEPAQGSFNISRCISCCNGYFQKKTAYHGILNSARPECAAALAHCIGDCWSVRNQMYIIAGQGVINSLRGLFRR